MSDISEVSEMIEIPGDSPVAGASAEKDNCEKFVIFSIMGKLYSFQSRHIGEIALFDAVYPLPLMPSYVLGVVNRYSIPYALFDIGILFYNTPIPRKKVLIVKEEIERIAFVIEDVSGIADIPFDKLIVNDRSGDSNDLTEAVSASFNWNGSDVFVLDIQRILSRVSAGAA